MKRFPFSYFRGLCAFPFASVSTKNHVNGGGEERTHQNGGWVAVTLSSSKELGGRQSEGLSFSSTSVPHDMADEIDERQMGAPLTTEAPWIKYLTSDSFIFHSHREKHFTHCFRCHSMASVVDPDSFIVLSVNTLDGKLLNQRSLI